MDIPSRISGSVADGSAFIKQQLDLGESGFAGATLRGHIRLGQCNGVEGSEVTERVYRTGTVHQSGIQPDEEVAPDDALERSVEWLEITRAALSRPGRMGCRPNRLPPYNRATAPCRVEPATTGSPGSRALWKESIGSGRHSRRPRMPR